MSKKPTPDIQLIPTGHNVLIEPILTPDVTPGGIALPFNAHRNYLEGKVIAVGTGYIDGGCRVPLEIEVGETVVYQLANNNKLVEVDGYAVLPAHQILLRRS